MVRVVQGRRRLHGVEPDLSLPEEPVHAAHAGLCLPDGYVQRVQIADQQLRTGHAGLYQRFVGLLHASQVGLRV